MLVQTDDQEFVRDTDSKGLLSTDRTKLLKARAARTRAKTTNSELVNLKKELEELRPKLLELEQLKRDIAQIKEMMCLKRDLTAGL